MTAEQLDHFRSKLASARAALEDRILGAQAQAQQQLDPVAATEDRPEHSDLADTSLAFGTLYTRRREKITDAVLRLDLGEYGVCTVCGEPIELERLEAEPTARLCEEDARDAERSRATTL